MANGPRIRLGIVFGGRSGEHEVSLTSAASVISALDPEEFEITAIGITRAGKLAGAAQLREMLPQPLLSRVRPYSGPGAGRGARPIASLLSSNAGESDGAPMVIFPLLHGPYGEDGTFQGLLEMAGLPYIGCGVLASAVGMDKDVMKRIFLQAGLPVAPFSAVLARDIAKGLDSVKKAVSRQFGYPMFSKPANLGSSVGVCKIHSEKEFEKSVRYAARFDRKVLIEKGIDGRELECAILGNDTARSSVVGEVLSAHEFYDYDAKYLSPASRLEIPARIEDRKMKEIRDLAVRSFQAIDGSGLARVDFFLERTSGKVWINEINTMPGFTPISMYAKLWAASGIRFDELVRRLVRFGLDRFKQRNAQQISAK